jgi:hypothetical protein
MRFKSERIFGERQLTVAAQIKLGSRLEANRLVRFAVFAVIANKIQMAHSPNSVH